MIMINKLFIFFILWYLFVRLFTITSSKSSIYPQLWLFAKEERIKRKGTFFVASSFAFSPWKSIILLICTLLEREQIKNYLFSPFPVPLSTSLSLSTLNQPSILFSHFSSFYFFICAEKEFPIWKLFTFD